jgi:hypothetical protein
MIREPVVAGMFYPDDPGELRRTVAGYIEESGEEPDDAVRGIVSPHAGYVYSGPVAGAAFAAAGDDVRRVVIIAPSHRYPVYGSSVLDARGFRTPLGVADIDRETVSALLESGFSFEPRAHSSEHSTEVQIPFVQVRWPKAQVVVIIQGEVSSEHSHRLAGALADLIDDGGDTLMVASSDMSHYHPVDQAKELDRRVADAFLSADPERLVSVLRKGSGEACGAGPILTLLSWARRMGYTGTRELAYDTSATASGDRSAVVGYFAGALTEGD